MVELPSAVVVSLIVVVVPMAIDNDVEEAFDVVVTTDTMELFAGLVAAVRA